MDITREERPGYLLLKVAGRLDGYWADHLDRELAEVIRSGARHVRLDASAVAFLSSAGIRILIKRSRELGGIRGSFAVVEPSPQVHKVLELSGLLDALTEAAGEPEPEAPKGSTLERDGCTFAVMPLEPSGTHRCRLVGSPTRLPAMEFAEATGTPLCAPRDTVLVGLGALGEEPGGADLFGELLAAGGTAAQQPCGYAATPDYLLATGAYVPQVTALYALETRGAFSHRLTFQSPGEGIPVRLGTLARAAQEATGSPCVVLVVIAETVGLVGAVLKQSPAGRPSGDFYDFPAIRDRLSYTPEHAWPRSLAMVAGVAASEPADGLAEFLRPMDSAGLQGHFHAAAFAYRALPTESGTVPEAVDRLFAPSGPQSVMHLLWDDRELAGAGESEFVRGTAWASPLGSVEAAQAKEGTQA